MVGASHVPLDTNEIDSVYRYLGAREAMRPLVAQSCRALATGTNFARMLRTRHAFWSRKAAAGAVFLQLAAVAGLSVVEASHNHLGPDTVQWHGHAGDHPDDGQSAHAPCILCAHGGACMLAANRAGVVHAPAVFGVRTHIQPSFRLAAVDAGFSARPRAPPAN